MTNVESDWMHWNARIIDVRHQGSSLEDRQQPQELELSAVPAACSAP